MKRVVLVLCILAGCISCAWADDSAMDTKPSVVYTILGGVIKSVSWADPAKGTESKIVVINVARKAINILVTPTTTFWDKDAKAIMPDGIISHKKVNVVYFTTDEGVNIAKSIKILK